MYPGATPSCVVLTNKRGGKISGRDLNCSKFSSVVGSSDMVCAATAMVRLSQRPALTIIDDSIDVGGYEMQAVVAEARASRDKKR